MPGSLQCSVVRNKQRTSGMPNDSQDNLTIRDGRTGREYALPITNSTVPAMGLREVKVTEDEFGMMSYDPAFKNTACCTSRITYIDGARGVLQYRGYPIEQLAEGTSFVEVCYALLEGDLPNRAQLDAFGSELASYGSLPSGLERTLDGFPRDAHPMSMLMGVLVALGAHDVDATRVRDPEARSMRTRKLIAQMPLLAAAVWRYRQGWQPIAARPELGYAADFLRMVGSEDGDVDPDPVLAHALDVLFILHGDHEQNCSTSTMRVVGSAEATPYAAAAAAVASLSGPLHGGANEAVLRMLAEIGDATGIPAYMQRVRDKEAKLMGFGHRVYKSYDPRARIIGGIAHEVFAKTGRNPLLDVAVELERIALAEEYFKARNLYPNVDFYSGLIYQSLGFDPAYFTVLFAIGRTPGWVAQWNEMMGDKEQKIARPRQVYVGERDRSVEPIDAR